MRVAAIVVSTARPSAPPSSREVLSRPEATPAGAAGTPCTATIVDGHEREAEARGGQHAARAARRRSRAPGRMPVSSASPTAAASMPPVIVQRAPSAATDARRARGAERDADVIGRNARPVSIAP